jgi:hypothetical protein
VKGTSFAKENYALGKHAKLINMDSTNIDILECKYPPKTIGNFVECIVPQ